MKQSSKQYFNLLSIIHIAFFVGQILFAAVSISIVTPIMETSISQSMTSMLTIALGVVMFAALGARTITQKRLQLLKEKPTLSEKLEGYKSVLITRLAILEGATLVVVAFYYVQQHFLFLVIAGGALVIFFLHRPVKAKVIDELALDYSEREYLEDPAYLI